MAAFWVYDDDDEEEVEAKFRLQIFEENLRYIGTSLQSPPDDTEGLLNLLYKVQFCLLQVDQSPLKSMSSAIRPAMTALVRKELLGHVNTSVKLAVASCISQIARITAPEIPYDDDVMKDALCIIVAAFEHLDEIDSPSFATRVSILETVAKVRLCVVMLDVQCDVLIREMFRHFFKTVSSNHPENVMFAMVTTMQLVIEESEDVHTELASCLLENVKNVEKENPPASFVLAEKVIGLCQEKLKPVFQQLLQGTPLNEYSKIVTSVLHVKEGNNVDPPGKDVEMEQDVSHAEQDGSLSNAISSNATSVDNEPKKPSDDAVIHSDAYMNDTKAASGAADDASKPADGTPDVTKPRQGRPPGQKSLAKKAPGKNHPSGVALKKHVTADSAGRLTKRSAKSSTRKAGEGESSKKQHKISSKQQKDETFSEEDSPMDLSLKTPRSRKNRGLDGSLVGAKIKVWRPDDKRFYKGFVDSFDTFSKRHKIAYDDGDIEVLLLRDEKWEFISEEKDKTPDVVSEMPRGTKGRENSVQPLKGGNAWRRPMSGCSCSCSSSRSRVRVRDAIAVAILKQARGMVRRRRRSHRDWLEGYAYGRIAGIHD